MRAHVVLNDNEVGRATLSSWPAPCVSSECPVTLREVPQFSVVIPTHERPDFLAAAVASVQAQTVTDWECIVVVDGGPMPPQPEDPRVSIVPRATSGGPGVARNAGIEHATGTYVTFLDDDDTWLPDRLAIAVEGLALAPVAVCFGISDGELAWRGDWSGDVSDTILDRKAPSVNGVAVRRDSCPLFDPAFRGAEDVEWLLRLARDVPFATVPKPGFVRGNFGTPRPDQVPRVEGVRGLLERHAEYFDSHPRAAARCWEYYAEVSLKVGRRHQARAALQRAFMRRPSVRVLRSWLNTWIVRG
jgi:glycosyltransferase involved in cell wall biosynthesis